MWYMRRIFERSSKKGLIVFVGPSREISIEPDGDNYVLVVPVNKATLKNLMDDRWANKDVIVEIQEER